MKRVFLILVLSVLVSSCTKPNVDGDQKIVNAALASDIKGFDPMTTTDVYTHVAVNQVYQGLLAYHYLKRPYELIPELAESMPEISKDLTHYKFKIRQGVFFRDDPCFKGVKRELRADDFVYSLKRLADPNNKSPNWWLLEGKIQGLDAFREKLKNLKPPIDYSKYPVEGLSATDKNTLVVKLLKPYRQFLYALAMAGTKAVAREAVEFYGDEFLNHAVGTGPFILKRWRRGQRVEFVRNPNYWDDRYPSEGEKGDKENGLLASAGQKLPIVDGVNLWIYVESQPLWLNFLRGNLDAAGIPKEAYDSVFNKNKEVKEDIVRRKIVVRSYRDPDLVMYFFNMKDEVVGKNKFLRQAMSAAVNRPERIELFYNNRAIVAHGPVPPGLFGYDPDLKNPYDYNLENAKALVEKAKKRHKELTGEDKLPTILYDITNSTASRQMAEAMVSDMKAIGIHLDLRTGTWPQFQDRVRKASYQLGSMGWSADYPDSENFLQLLYGPNSAPGPNASSFQNERYDELYENMRDLPDGAKRKKMIDEMAKIAQDETPWIIFAHRIAYGVHHRWLRNNKRNDFTPGHYKYYDIDEDLKKETQKFLK